MKSVMMIGGGIQQVRAVELAHELGYRVIVTDRLEHPHCREIADEFYRVDGRDTEGLIALALRLRAENRLDGVFTLSELVTSVSAVAHAAGIPGAPLAGTVRCQDKGLAKRSWLEAGVSTPDGGEAETAEEALRIFSGWEGRGVVKPVTGFGGKGVRVVDNKRELQEAVIESDAPGSGRWLVEEHAGGTMHDVNGLIDAGGEFHPLGIVDRFFLEDWPVERELRYPTALDDERRREFFRLLESGVRAFGIDFGPVKSDAVLSGGEGLLFEVAPRLHGPKNSIYLLPFAGLNALAPTLQVLTGGEMPDRAEWEKERRHAICRAILPPPGRIRSIRGVERAEALPGVDEVLLLKSEGEEIPAYRNNTHVPAYVFASGDSFEACEEILGEALEIIEIETG